MTSGSSILNADRCPATSYTCPAARAEDRRRTEDDPAERALTRAGGLQCFVSARDVDFVALQHLGEVAMQAVVAHLGQHLAQLLHHPTLAAIEEGDALGQPFD